MSFKLTGLIAATHSPFHSDGSLNLSIVEKQAEALIAEGVTAAFICGSTGECHSLTLAERLALCQRWSEVIRGTPLKLIVHVGSNCLSDSRAVATDAAARCAAAIAAMPPSYFKPRTLDDLIACCSQIASAAPATPFYYYDIPSMTGVAFPMPRFLALASPRIPNLAGVKFSNPDLMAYQQCLHQVDEKQNRFDCPFGIDEWFLAALALGATGGVGSTYNFAAPLYHRLIASFRASDLPAAQLAQYRSTQLVDTLASFGYMSAAKATMTFLGIDVGPARLPSPMLADADRAALRKKLDEISFFEWGRHP